MEAAGLNGTAGAPISSTNGASTTNGAPNAHETLAAGFRRGDVVRLITQCLTGLGYENVARKLEQD